jgi:hypothetical protein
MSVSGMCVFVLVQDRAQQHKRLSASLVIHNSIKQQARVSIRAHHQGQKPALPWPLHRRAWHDTPPRPSSSVAGSLW